MEKNEIVIRFESNRTLNDRERNDLVTRLWTEIAEPEIIDEHEGWIPAEYDTVVVSVDFSQIP